jgi:hypothetical protein
MTRLDVISLSSGHVLNMHYMRLQSLDRCVDMGPSIKEVSLSTLPARQSP